MCGLTTKKKILTKKKKKKRKKSVRNGVKIFVDQMKSELGKKEKKANK